MNFSYFRTNKHRQCHGRHEAEAAELYGRSKAEDDLLFREKRTQSNLPWSFRAGPSELVLGSGQPWLWGPFPPGQASGSWLQMLIRTHCCHLRLSREGHQGGVCWSVSNSKRRAARQLPGLGAHSWRSGELAGQRPSSEMC